MVPAMLRMSAPLGVGQHMADDGGGFGLALAALIDNLVGEAGKKRWVRALSAIGTRSASQHSCEFECVCHQYATACYQCLQEAKMPAQI